MSIKELLLTFLDISAGYLDFFDTKGYYKKPIKDYQKWRRKYKITPQEIYRLKKLGLLGVNKKEFYLTEKALKKIQYTNLDKMKIKIPESWDGLWRLVIFDIPEKKKAARDFFRKKLKELGFEVLQKSVFCYPYDCLQEVTILIKTYEIEPFVTYLEVSNIVTGKDLFKAFKAKNLF